MDFSQPPVRPQYCRTLGNDKLWTFFYHSGISAIFGSHSGANIAETVLKVLDKYKIASKLGYIMTVNATSNYSALLSYPKA